MLISAASARVCALLSVICLVSLSAAGAEPLFPNPFRASTKAPATLDTGPVAKACGVRGKALGKVVEKGAGGWKLHDTAPGSTAARNFYLTGFKDGCPRRLEGSVAMFGDVELYEMIHYGPVGLKPGGSDTDKAYARIRSKVCGSAKSTCSDRQVKRLSKSATFVSVYPSSSGSSHLELLISRGKLTAVSKK